MVPLKSPNSKPSGGGSSLFRTAAMRLLDWKMKGGNARERIIRRERERKF
jgi:hypothetical protein